MAPSPTIRRLLKETSELSSASKNPNPAFYAAPVSDTDLHEWHFTLLGPPSPSPYAGGLYHGRISLPPTYPLKPPNFRFLTPSGRFEVNREICLSISGFHEETWMPAWGVRTALTALRSFMAESGTAGQVGGLESSKEMRERLAKESRGWKCLACAGRSNEEIMKEWWQDCAAQGVKVGEDIGLEALPEGLSLEAKVPGERKEDKGKAKDEAERNIAGDSQTLGNLHVGDESVGQQNQSTAPALDTVASNIHRSSPEEQPTSLPSNESPIAARATAPVSVPPLSQSQTSTPTAPAIRQRQPHQPNPSTTSINSTFSEQLTPAGLPPLPTTTSPPSNRRQDEEHTTITLDRVIYAVFVALFVMCVKKIFYPASRGSDWDDYSLVKE